MVADPEKISITAKLPRVLGHRLRIQVAALIGVEDAYAKLAKNHGLDGDQLTPYAPMFEARYKGL